MPADGTAAIHWSRSGSRSGVALAVGAYFLWGLLPAYMKLLGATPPLQIIAHRVLWSLGLTAAIVLIVGRWSAVVQALRSRRLLAQLAASAILIAINWLVYVWAVLNQHVLEASLGYFINPLVNVALGVMVLKERLRPVQKAAVLLAAIGVGVLAASGGAAIWISLSLALSFGLYGLVRKIAPVDPLAGLTIETAILAPLALAYLLWTAHVGQAAFGHSTGLDLLLIASGAVTAAPLLLFAAAAKRLPYAALGVLQYIAPTLQFLQAVLLFGEPFTPVHGITFAFIWGGLVIYAIDSIRAATTVPPPK